VPSPSPQSERRRALRAAAGFPVKLSTKPEAAPALLRDISEIGLACTSNHAIPEMTLVGLDFSLPGASDVHQVKGAVVRCEPLGESSKAAASKQWDVAIYFTEITPVTRAALSNYIGKAKKV
jgi:hypothetical protein